MAVRVVLDSDVLVPMPLCDTLLRMAEAELFQPLWSSETLNEVERTLVALGKAPSAAHRRVSQMSRAFPDALVADFKSLEAVMPNDPKDRHVSAAASAAGAGIIVTRNLRHFATLPDGIDAVSPDEFLLRLLSHDPVLVAGCLRRQVLDMRNPPTDVGTFLGWLARTVPRFAAAVKGVIES